MADDTTNAINQATVSGNPTSNQVATSSQPSDDAGLALLRQSPFGPLLDIPGVNGVQDIFGNVAPPSGGSAFGGSAGATLNANSPYGGNPFAGDNFWNIFAGGVNPSNPATTGAGGGAPGGGGAGGGFGGGGAGGGFAGGGGNSSGGSPLTTSGSAVDPFSGDNFWNIFAGGVNPTTFSSENLPSQAFVGGSAGGGTTPVPEPSSMIGIAVIGFGIAAGKFNQQRRAAKASNFNK